MVLILSPYPIQFALHTCRIYFKEVTPPDNDLVCAAITFLAQAFIDVNDRRAFEQAIISLQVRVWFAAVKIRSGLSNNELARRFPSTPSPAQSGASLPSTSGYLPSQSGYWDQIRRGQHLPLRRQHGRELVDKVEAAFPNTKRWIVLPLWELLSLRPIGLTTIYGILATLHPSIRKLILIDPEALSVFVRMPPNKELYRRLDKAARPLYPDDDSDVFGRLTGGAIATLALIREAELIQQQPLHVLGRKAWSTMAERLQHFPEMKEFWEELANLGKRRFLGTIYSPDGATTVTVPI